MQTYTPLELPPLWSFHSKGSHSTTWQGADFTVCGDMPQLLLLTTSLPAQEEVGGQASSHTDAPNRTHMAPSNAPHFQGQMGGGGPHTSNVITPHAVTSYSAVL